MDLYAYSQIQNLSIVASNNGISVPRLRGYRYMLHEEPIKYSKEDLASIGYDEACDLVCSIPRWQRSNFSVYSYKSRKAKRKFLHSGKIQWHLIHGKDRKSLKFNIKRRIKSVIKQAETFNKYVGMDDVLYVHARIGGKKWSYYGGIELQRQPWFLEKVDDAYDSTYCDIYAKIDPSTVNGIVYKENNF